MLERFRHPLCPCLDKYVTVIDMSRCAICVVYFVLYKAYELVNLIPISILNPKISCDNHRPTCYLNIVNDSGLVCFRSWRFKVTGVSTIIDIIRCSMRETRETALLHAWVQSPIRTVSCISSCIFIYSTKWP